MRRKGGHKRKIMEEKESDRAASGPMAFFKVMFGDCVDVLNIPPHFAPKVAGMVDQKILLKNSCNKYFEVELQRDCEDGSYFIREGWRPFLLANKIDLKHLLVFELIDGTSFISVREFNINGCERVKMDRRGQQREDYSSAPKAFFKVIVPNSMDSLNVPSGFATRVEGIIGKSPKTIFLQNSKNKIFKVRIERDRKNGSYFIKKGWSSFLFSNAIDFGYFLIFDLTDDASFSVRVFTTSGCERVDCDEISGMNSKTQIQRLKRDGRKYESTTSSKGEKSERGKTKCNLGLPKSNSNDEEASAHDNFTKEQIGVELQHDEIKGKRGSDFRDEENRESDEEKKQSGCVILVDTSSDEEILVKRRGLGFDSPNDDTCKGGEIACEETEKEQEKDREATNFKSIERDKCEIAILSEEEEEVHEQETQVSNCKYEKEETGFTNFESMEENESEGVQIACKQGKEEIRRDGDNVKFESLDRGKYELTEIANEEEPEVEESNYHIENSEQTIKSIYPYQKDVKRIFGHLFLKYPICTELKDFDGGMVARSRARVLGDSSNLDLSESRSSGEEEYINESLEKEQGDETEGNCGAEYRGEEERESNEGKKQVEMLVLDEDLSDGEDTREGVDIACEERETEGENGNEVAYVESIEEDLCEEEKGEVEVANFESNEGDEYERGQIACNEDKEKEVEEEEEEEIEFTNFESIGDDKCESGQIAIEEHKEREIEDEETEFENLESIEGPKCERGHVVFEEDEKKEKEEEEIEDGNFESMDGVARERGEDQENEKIDFVNFESMGGIELQRYPSACEQENEVAMGEIDFEKIGYLDGDKCEGDEIVNGKELEIQKHNLNDQTAPSEQLIKSIDPCMKDLDKSFGNEKIERIPLDGDKREERELVEGKEKEETEDTNFESTDEVAKEQENEQETNLESMEEYNCERGRIIWEEDKEKEVEEEEEEEEERREDDTIFVSMEEDKYESAQMAYAEEVAEKTLEIEKSESLEGDHCERAHIATQDEGKEEVEFEKFELIDDNEGLKFKSMDVDNGNQAVSGDEIGNEEKIQFEDKDMEVKSGFFEPQTKMESSVDKLPSEYLHSSKLASISEPCGEKESTEKEEEIEEVVLPVNFSECCECLEKDNVESELHSSKLDSDKKLLEKGKEIEEMVSRVIFSECCKSLKEKEALESLVINPVAILESEPQSRDLTGSSLPESNEEDKGKEKALSPIKFSVCYESLLEKEKENNPEPKIEKEEETEKAICPVKEKEKENDALKSGKKFKGELYESELENNFSNVSSDSDANEKREIIEGIMQNLFGNTSGYNCQMTKAEEIKSESNLLNGCENISNNEVLEEDCFISNMGGPWLVSASSDDKQDGFAGCDAELQPENSDHVTQVMVHTDHIIKVIDTPEPGANPEILSENQDIERPESMSYSNIVKDIAQFDPWANSETSVENQDHVPGNVLVYETNSEIPCEDKYLALQCVDVIKDRDEHGLDILAEYLDVEPRENLKIRTQNHEEYEVLEPMSTVCMNAIKDRGVCEPGTNPVNQDLELEVSKCVDTEKDRDEYEAGVKSVISSGNQGLELVLALVSTDIIMGEEEGNFEIPSGNQDENQHGDKHESGNVLVYETNSEIPCEDKYLALQCVDVIKDRDEHGQVVLAENLDVEPRENLKIRTKNQEEHEVFEPMSTVCMNAIKDGGVCEPETNPINQDFELEVSKCVDTEKDRDEHEAGVKSVISSENQGLELVLALVSTDIVMREEEERNFEISSENRNGDKHESGNVLVYETNLEIPCEGKCDQGANLEFSYENQYLALQGVDVIKDREEHGLDFSAENLDVEPRENLKIRTQNHEEYEVLEPMSTVCMNAIKDKRVCESGTNPINQDLELEVSKCVDIAKDPDEYEAGVKSVISSENQGLELVLALVSTDIVMGEEEGDFEIPSGNRDGDKHESGNELISVTNVKILSENQDIETINPVYMGIMKGGEACEPGASSVIILKNQDLKPEGSNKCEPEGKLAISYENQGLEIDTLHSDMSPAKEEKCASGYVDLLVQEYYKLEEKFFLLQQSKKSVESLANEKGKRVISNYDSQSDKLSPNPKRANCNKGPERSMEIRSVRRVNRVNFAALLAPKRRGQRQKNAKIQTEKEVLLEH